MYTQCVLYWQAAEIKFRMKFEHETYYTTMNVALLKDTHRNRKYCRHIFFLSLNSSHLCPRKSVCIYVFSVVVLCMYTLRIYNFTYYDYALHSKYLLLMLRATPGF